MMNKSTTALKQRYERPEVVPFDLYRPSLLVTFSAEADFEDFVEGEDL